MAYQIHFPFLSLDSHADLIGRSVVTYSSPLDTHFFRSIHKP